MQSFDFCDEFEIMMVETTVKKSVEKEAKRKKTKRTLKVKQLPKISQKLTFGEIQDRINKKH